MTMPDAIFWQELIACRIRRIADGCGISRIPVQHEISVGNRLEDGGRLFSGRGVAGHFVFEQEYKVVFRPTFGGSLQLCIDRLTIRLRIVQAPEIKTANPVRLESVRQGNTVFEELILGGGVNVRMELVARFALR